MGGRLGPIRYGPTEPQPQFVWKCPGCKWRLLVRCGKRTKQIHCIFCKKDFKVKDLKQSSFVERRK